MLSILCHGTQLKCLAGFICTSKAGHTEHTSMIKGRLPSKAGPGNIFVVPG
jgi:hypothetical protein